MNYLYYRRTVDTAKQEALKILEKRIKESGLGGYAHELKVSPAYLCDVRYKRRGLTDKLLKELLG